MFWEKNFTPSQSIEALLEKENATVEEFLDDEDILQECKSLKKAIVNYFTRPEVIKRLVELVTTEPPADVPMAHRFRYANMACEILILRLPTLDEKLLGDADTLQQLYSYLENEPPMNPLLSSFFSKTFSMLFVKKPEQDWFLYQQMCLQFLEYIKSKKNFMDLICKHFATPIIPDLIMQMVNDVEGGQLKRNLFKWLCEDKLVERLIALLADPAEAEKHTYVAEFLCDLIHQGRTMRQTEQENDSFEPAFEGSNPILKNIESEATIEELLNVILEPNALESAIVSGISVVLTLIKPVVFVEEPNSDRLKYIQDREKEIHEAILATVISVIAPRLKEFNDLLQSPPQKAEIITTAGKLEPPFGMTRLQICRVFTVLLQTRNEKVANAICETDFFVTVLGLFKQYCWNNFLHSEVEKCLQLIFYTQLAHNNNNNSTQGSTIVNDGSFGRGSNNGDTIGTSFFDFISKPPGSGGGSTGCGEGDNCADAMDTTAIVSGLIGGTTIDDQHKDTKAAEKDNDCAVAEVKENNATADNEEQIMDVDERVENDNEQALNVISKGVPSEETKDEVAVPPPDSNAAELEVTKTSADITPSALQTHVIVDCKLISKLIDCWQHNSSLETAAKGRRLGYMGHLIKIFKHITNCISESEHIGALIESSLRDDANELELWQTLVQPTDGEFTKALAIQRRMLANCNAHETNNFIDAKDFQQDTSTWDYIMSSISNMGALRDTITNEDIVFALEHEMYRNDMLDNDNETDNDNGAAGLNLFQLGAGSLADDDDDEDGEERGQDDDGNVEKSILGGEVHSMFGKSAASTGSLQVFGVTNSPWDNLDPFSDLTAANSNALPTVASSSWTGDFSADNFADFDAHFSAFTNDLGSSLSEPPTEELLESHARLAERQTRAPLQSFAAGKELSAQADRLPAVSAANEEYDNNANVDKFASKSTTGSTVLPINDFGHDDQLKHKDDEADENMKNEKVAVSAALVRNLHSVMDDSDDIDDDDDDYEDDEGMWTKPLGGHASTDADEADATTTTTITSPAMTNGPSKFTAAAVSSNATASPEEQVTSGSSLKCNSNDIKAADVNAADLQKASPSPTSAAAPATKT